MSVPLDQQRPPPVVASAEPNFDTRPAHTSVGPVIEVLTVIIIFGVLAGLLGRLCYGRKIMCCDYYDLESWVERKCSACVDGRITLTPSRSTTSISGSSLDSSVPVPPSQQTEETPQNTPSNDCS